MRHMVCGIGNVYVNDVLEQAVINFKRISQVAPQLDFVVVHNGSKLHIVGAKSAVYDCLAFVLLLLGHIAVLRT